MDNLSQQYETFLLFLCQVVVVLPSNRKDKYDLVKKYLCVDCPTPSQCVLSRTLSRPQALMTVATKIALQMACKMGGELWSVEIPVSPEHTQINLYLEEIKS